jgi:DNA-binding XRE family transcriptional regulator
LVENWVKSIVKIYLYKIFFEKANLVVYKQGMGIETFQKKLGKNIALLRKKAGLSQTELAHRIDKDRQWMHYIEKGEGNPTVKTLYLIASELKTSMKDLLDFE